MIILSQVLFVIYWKMMMGKCNKPVVIEYLWGQEYHYACLKHAEQAEIISNVLGLSTNPRFVISDKLCQHEIKDGE